MIERRSIDYIPRAERHGRAWQLWPIWFTNDAQLATLAIGAIGTAAGLNLLWSGIAIVFGSALGCFFMAFHAAQGPQLGLPQMIQSRPQFGAKGALLVWLVALTTYIGYNALNEVLAGQSLHALTGVSPSAGGVMFVTAALAIALAGYGWIHAAQRILAAIMIVALLLFSVAAGHLPFPAGQFAPGGFHLNGFIAQFFAAAAYQLSWSIYVSDYSRYLPRETGVRAAFWWTFLGANCGGVWMMLAGMVLAASHPGLETAAAVRAGGDALVPGFGAVLLVASLGGLLTITGLNLYGASLTLLSSIDSFRRLRPTRAKRLLATLLLGCVSALLAYIPSGDFMDRLGDLLAIMLYLFTPWTAINLVDFYVIRRGHYSVREILNPAGMYGAWNWRGLSAYGAGFVAMIPFFSTGLYMGPAARALDGADIAMVIGLPVAALVYFLACRSMDLERDRAMAQQADIGLE